ncbi:MAG TPA: LysM peptidoglycan-binding domain-containing protein [Flavisolibacter sp.]|jgi:LysM repeat protein|nr:LysM peptidoglycan-binding domain-containing protein [Flavisolibacter sp.]
MKRFLFLTFLSLLCAGVFAQDIIVRRNDKGLYTVHTVAPKESLYSLGRLYNTPPKDIAAYNGFEIERGLNVGQTVNIPLTATNFSQEKSTSHPVYYVVGEKEGLYRVSVNNNKVLMASLRKWNNLPSDVISAGQKLVVGYLLTSEAPATATTVTPKNNPPAEKPVVETPAEKKEPIKAEVVKKEPEKTVQKEPVVEKRTEQPRVTTTTVNDVAGGYFKPAFDAQARQQPAKKDEIAMAGIFKTASGWQDAKYYALIDGIEPGTIIRIVNPSNSQAVYAKVLDKMTGIRQNQGYNMRISNAAATALGIADTDKFSVRVNY